ncbi:MAG: IPT/TIG domain-containing protein [Candidatus Pseudobacter hemicellulosilyticus]|uniref:IPT/TIG domain-containing protein n=1 Tax=Candidatus Pseudobacter hemicellulosilyticus TaxID=3121375 RepID=A0AAJ5WWA7_9BACT|nr:MAG: IPT/TIG domain-containing protein [Pseudobacter sp.]
MRKEFFYCLLLVCYTMIACKKDKSENEALTITPFTVEKLSRSIVQAGQELTIYGQHLEQPELTTEVFLAGRPAAIVRGSADSLTVLVPEKVQTGSITVTLGKDSRFSLVYGPSVEVKPTPQVNGFGPVYAYGGETIELYTQHFSPVSEENELYIGNNRLEILSRKGPDTIIAKLPANATPDFLSWRTYNGPLQKMNVLFPLRLVNYPVQTVADWLKLDPAYTYMDTLVRGFPELAANYAAHKRIYDAALAYLQSPDSVYTIFLTNDGGYYKDKVTKADFYQKIRARSYNYNTLLIAAVSPGHALRLEDLQDGDSYPSAYTYNMQWDWGPDDVKNYITIQEQGGIKYAQITNPWGDTGAKVKILRELPVGKATIIELEGELGAVSME